MHLNVDWINASNYNRIISVYSQYSLPGPGIQTSPSSPGDLLLHSEKCCWHLFTSGDFDGRAIQVVSFKKGFSSWDCVISLFSAACEGCPPSQERDLILTSAHKCLTDIHNVSGPWPQSNGLLLHLHVRRS